MKKLILSVAVMASALAANAQMKPGAGSKSIEINSNLFGGLPFSLQGGGLMLKSYGSETSAMRLGVNLSYGSTKTTAKGDTTSSGTQFYSTSSSLTIGVAPGIEKHMGGTDRLSPYMGVELPIAYKMTSDKVERAVGADVQNVTTKGTGGYFSIGVNALAGVNYYLSKGLYCGAELGFGVMYKKDATVTAKDSAPNAASIKDVPTGSSMSFGPAINGMLRMGWNF